MRILTLGLALLAALPAFGDTITLQPVEVAEAKALFGRVESRFVVPARSRIGGTLVSVDVSEGSEVAAGQVIATIVDEKLTLQLSAADSRLAAARSELANATAELTRNEALLERGATTAQRVDLLRTGVEVAQNAVAELESSRAVIQQQMDEGSVLAPAAGRVLTVPKRLGEVVMPGEPVATVAGGGVFLRLAIPERHASELSTGAKVTLDDGEGVIEKVYPQIEEGRVIVDVAVDGLSDTFIGQRILVQVPVGMRSALVVPQQAIRHTSGLDLVAIQSDGGSHDVTVVPGPIVTTANGPMREVLTGLRAGDMVVLP
jgi:RND family efflux transporter MFP subunit